MTDLLTKVKAALELHESEFAITYDLDELAPDMARALIAAGELAEATRRLAKFSNSPAKAGRRWATYDCSQMTARVEDVGYTLDAFRAAMEGRTDD